VTSTTREMKKPFRKNGMPRKDYMWVHSARRKLYGSASAHKCVDCGGPANHWSEKHGADPYSLEREDIEPRCYGDHIRYDRSVA
jgi:hypothetical protein